MILEKKTEFKESKLGLIPIDWSVLNIGRVFDFLKTNSLSRSQLVNEELDKESIFNIHYGDIHSTFNYELLDLSKQEKLPKIIDNHALKSNPDFLKDGDLIIADASEDYLGLCDCVELMSIGELKLVSGLHTFALRDKSNNFASGFKSYVFKNQKVIKSIARIATGISVLGVTKSNLSKLLILVPPLKEQQKIAQILSQWDEAIETTQTLIEKLQLRKKGLMQELLSGKKRLPGFTEEWKEEKLGSYFTERKETGLDNLPLLSVGKEGVYPQDDSNKKDTSNSNKSKYKRICKGDIGYNTMRMWQGRSALSQLEGIVSPAYTILKPKENCDSVFFSHLFKLDDMIHKFYRNSQGMVSDTWMCKFKDFKIVRFNAPSSIEEQKAISKIIALADEEISEKEGYLEALKQQKKGLMQQLLTGQKRVKID